MTEPDRRSTLRDLGRRLDQARGRSGGAADEILGSQPQSPLGWAFRIGVELVAALVVGVGFGWLLDRWLGTMPVFLVVFFFLGAAAGGLNVWRVAARMGLDAGHRPPGDRGEGPPGTGPGVGKNQ